VSDDAGEWGALFGASTFVGLCIATAKRILNLGKLRLEDVASGYWTLFAEQSSGLVSHYGSTPSSSARPSTSVIDVGLLSPVIMEVFGRQRTDW